ncbi:MAG: zf-HC2 domain-containing protein [Anaerolineales bacterium]|nr:zf-HC2 domain-containing protein [Anaerolineales bacterium]
MDTHLTDETLNEYLDGVLAAKQQAELTAHLARCPACAARLEALRALFARLEALPAASLNRDLAPAVLQALSPTQPGAPPGVHPPRRLLPRLVLGVQLVGAMLLSILTWPFIEPQLNRWGNLPLPAPGLGDLAARAQAAWAAWLDPLHTLEMALTTALAWPREIVLPFDSRWLDLAGLAPSPRDAALALAGAAALWLAGHALLLRHPLVRLLRRRP